VLNNGPRLLDDVPFPGLDGELGCTRLSPYRGDRAGVDGAGYVRPTDDGYEVTVTARTILREPALFPDRLDPDAEVDDMLRTLLPGESATFRVTSRAPLDPVLLTTYPVLRCVNEIRPEREDAR